MRGMGSWGPSWTHAWRQSHLGCPEMLGIQPDLVPTLSHLLQAPPQQNRFHICDPTVLRDSRREVLLFSLPLSADETEL